MATRAPAICVRPTGDAGTGPAGRFYNEWEPQLFLAKRPNSAARFSEADLHTKS